MVKSFFNMMKMLMHIAVTASSKDLIPKAQQLAHQLNLTFAEKDLASYDYLLTLTPHFLGLQKPGQAFFHIDFLAGKMQYRARLASFRKELLARAIGAKPKESPYIVDATAGLGRDSFILATLGFHITLLERSVIFYALLKDALARAAQDKPIAAIIERLTLIHTDAIIWLKNLTPSNKKPDIIYLDPMFPERKKSASVKKEMVIMQDLLGKCADDVELFKQAISCAGKRVVVKRPKLAPNIADQAPNFSIKGKANRFDVYLK